MTYNVFGGTLNFAQSIYLSMQCYRLTTLEDCTLLILTM